ncbi:MAG: hypothetical protein RL754_1072 [Bacteroidota bacterium]
MMNVRPLGADVLICHSYNVGAIEGAIVLLYWQGVVCVNALAIK